MDSKEEEKSEKQPMPLPKGYEHLQPALDAAKVEIEMLTNALDMLPPPPPVTEPDPPTPEGVKRVARIDRYANQRRNLKERIQDVEDKTETTLEKGMEGLDDTTKESTRRMVKNHLKPDAPKFDKSGLASPRHVQNEVSLQADQGRFMDMLGLGSPSGVDDPSLEPGED